MPTTQLTPNTTANDTTVGSFAWNRTNSDLVADDGTESSVQLASSNISHYLFCTNFGFAIPVDATIAGLEVAVLRRVDNVGFTYPDITDYSIRLIRLGAIITGDDKAGVAVWGTAESWAYYGTGSDLWSATLTPAIVNDTTFGIAVSLDATGGITSAIAYIDQLIITITYNAYIADGTIIQFQQSKRFEIDSDTEEASSASYTTTYIPIPYVSWDNAGVLAFGRDAYQYDDDELESSAFITKISASAPAATVTGQTFVFAPVVNGWDDDDRGWHQSYVTAIGLVIADGPICGCTGSVVKGVSGFGSVVKREADGTQAARVYSATKGPSGSGSVVKGDCIC
jgi:hypothetical protein